jgi:aryl-alcohol dehydrogenase
MKITAAVARDAGAPFGLEEVELADLQPDEVLVRMVAVGICHTDVAARDQSLPIALPAVLGHEGAGIVERVGSAVSGLLPGDKVVLTIAFCGECTNCRRGDVAYCEVGLSLNYSGARPDGSPTLCCGETAISGHFFGQSSFATYAIANQRNAIKVHAGADLTLAAPLGCGIQTGAGAAMRSLDVQPGRSFAVFGGGSVGLSAAMGAKIRGCDPIIVVEPVADRRTLALEIGATHALDPAAGDIAEQIRAIVTRGVDYIVDTTGVVPVIQTALAALAGHGAIALVGVPKNPEASLPLLLLGFLISGATIKSVIEGDTDPATFIPELLAHAEQGRLPLDKLTRIYPFDQINAAIDDQLAGRVVKPILTF